MAMYSNYVVSTSSSDAESEHETSNKSTDVQQPTKIDIVKQSGKNDKTEKHGDETSGVKPERSRSRSHDRNRHSARTDEYNKDKDRFNSRRRSPNDRNKRNDRYGDRRDRDRNDYGRNDKRDRNFNERSGDDNNRRRGYREPRKNFQETSNKLKEQVERRKMLWKQGNQEKKVADHWSAMLSTCSDGKQAEKLKKLIGLKSSEGDGPSTEPFDARSTETSAEVPTTSGASAALCETTRLRQEELFRNLNQQYEMGRMSTHTHRGLGLGFGSQMAEYTAQIQNLGNQNQAGNQ